MKQTYHSINPHQLYKNSEEGIISGVCAGIADYLGVSKTLVRFLFMIGFLFNFFLMLLSYIILSILLERKPDKIFHNKDEEIFWRGVSSSPKETFLDLRYKFRNMNNRLSKIETYVTSSEFELNSKINNL